MTTLMKRGLAVFVLGFVASGAGSGAAGPEPPLATAMQQYGHSALVAIERGIHDHMRETSRMQLLETLPAALAATPVQDEDSAELMVARAAAEPKPVRVVVTFGGNSGSSADSGERAALRWQSLLPGMMK